jgi:hypothetical protein
MDIEKYRIEDLFQTIENNFLFLVSCMSFGSYFHHFGQSHVLPNLKDIFLKDISRSGYFIPRAIQEHALRKGKFERIGISAAMRAIFAAMNEVLQNNPDFCDQLTTVLKENNEAFGDLIRLLRNVYSHEITWASTGEVVLKNQDFKGFIAYRERNRKSMSISFDISYADVMRDVPVREGYGIHFQLSLGDLQEGKTLSSIINLTNQLLMAELCFNLCTYLSSKNGKPPSWRILA